MSIQKTLIEQKNKAIKDIEDLKEATKPVKPDVSLGRLTRMDVIAQKSMNEESLRAAEMRLKKIKRAIKALEDEEYGFCLNCEEEISTARLKAIPYATICINCSG